MREIFLEITFEVAQPILIKVLNISFGYVFGLQVFLMGFLKLFRMSVDVETAENLAHVIDDTWFVVNEVGGAFLDGVKVKFFVRWFLIFFLWGSSWLVGLILSDWWVVCVDGGDEVAGESGESELIVMEQFHCGDWQWSIGKNFTKKAKWLTSIGELLSVKKKLFSEVMFEHGVRKNKLWTKY